MAPTPIKHFLLIYDHKRGQLVETREFGRDSQRAVRSYQDLEQAHREEPWMDIVLVGSDSLETIQITHANYFTARSDTLEHTLRQILDAAHTVKP